MAVEPCACRRGACTWGTAGPAFGGWSPRDGPTGSGERQGRPGFERLSPPVRRPPSVSGVAHGVNLGKEFPHAFPGTIWPRPVRPVARRRSRGPGRKPRHPRTRPTSRPPRRRRGIITRGCSAIATASSASGPMPRRTTAWTRRLLRPPSRPASSRQGLPISTWPSRTVSGAACQAGEVVVGPVTYIDQGALAMPWSAVRSRMANGPGHAVMGGPVPGMPGMDLRRSGWRVPSQGQFGGPRMAAAAPRGAARTTRRSGRRAFRPRRRLTRLHRAAARDQPPVRLRRRSPRAREAREDKQKQRTPRSPTTPRRSRSRACPPRWSTAPTATDPPVAKPRSIRQDGPIPWPVARGSGFLGAGRGIPSRSAASRADGQGQGQVRTEGRIRAIAGKRPEMPVATVNREVGCEAGPAGEIVRDWIRSATGQGRWSRPRRKAGHIRRSLA